MKTFFAGIFYKFIYLAEDRVSIWSKIDVWFKMIMASAPIVFLSDLAGAWFEDNKQFATFVAATIILNAAVGMRRHSKNKTFRWETFFKKTGLMIFSVIVSYALLEMLIATAGDNYVTNGFKVLIQVATLFYPASKALKSIFILTNGEYPPKWLMQKVYNFEADGNLSEFLSSPGGSPSGESKIEEEPNLEDGSIGDQ